MVNAMVTKPSHGKKDTESCSLSINIDINFIASSI